jgi:hypothetical protein
VAAVDAAVGKIGRGMPLDLGVRQGQEDALALLDAAPAAPIELLVDAPDQLDVLLRHRPLSIPRRRAPVSGTSEREASP